MTKLADRTRRIAGSPTMKVTATVDRLRREGVEVIDFGAGEPDFPTPDAIKAAAHAALDQNFTRYTPSSGIADLRRAIGDRYRADYGVDYTESEVIVTAGGKQALDNATLALFGPGDEVITHAPYWPTLTEQIKLADAAPVLVRTHAEEGFAIRANAILNAVTPKTRGILVNSPCNPTGALISEADLAAIADVALRQDIWIIVDLCYEKLIYDPVPHNLPRVLADRCRDLTVLCGSASKAYAMTGWRCGWAVGPANVIAAAGAIQSHTTSNVTSITQKAAVAALTGSQAPVRAMLDEYRTRRDQLHAWLTAEPHMAGSPRDRLLADGVRDRWREYGLEQVEIVEHQVLLPYGIDVRVDMTAPTPWRAAMTEAAVEGDPFSARDTGPAFHAYSASGDVTAPVVYA
ncbi:MAG: aminotransferase class I/II-fold pyridoxal phosphate-dependent enzyme, partial [Acidobacteria bacterium]|nr:aminotransferase class I/II-fold pyridoxal phosphate-dependent enzyme [Acidobacteriota bacterium]